MVEQQSELVTGLEIWLWWKQAISEAIANNIPVAEVDWLLQEVAGLEPLAIRLQSFKDAHQIQLSLPMAKLAAGWHRRIHERLPVQYITGVTSWRRFRMEVSPAVLIPRPETECLIDLVAEVADRQAVANWVDLGTGSGAIALGLAEVLTKCQIYASEYSLDALAIAKRNAINAGLGDRIHFYQGDWWQPLEFLRGQVGGMVSNPPYIPRDTVLTLQPEVTNHEPHLALDGGEDGLDFIRHLIHTAPDYLASGGIWLIEMMAGQAEVVRDLLGKQGNYRDIEIHSDLAGIERFALAYRI
ncbi:peptide chain release factor N(5)-glutamine methyltransferase [Calothrix sp. 336/3]|uniref:peptide chain release factor N(5)-glutamine methyltransferase n=1 Tax=Calothrix sp. 336/3 TaxID=1337936 RepID=UPI0004E40190|nr:peptide chain release factor N(5)-glutamine methyltransferase [Calothrix sp. 336/3]AKG23426.1 SAM-dependent methyltransferase [Calothrix sp. 336/3]